MCIKNKKKDVEAAQPCMSSDSTLKTTPNRRWGKYTIFKITTNRTTLLRSQCLWIGLYIYIHNASHPAPLLALVASFNPFIAKIVWTVGAIFIINVTSCWQVLTNQNCSFRKSVSHEMNAQNVTIQEAHHDDVLQVCRKQPCHGCLTMT